MYYTGLRERLICAALTGLLADPEDQDLAPGAETCDQSVAIMAICYADAVIKELKKDLPHAHSRSR